MDPRKVFVVCSIAIPLFAWGSFVSLLKSFSVVREVILEPKQFNSPGGIFAATGGGYYVVGDNDEAWTTKTDGKGKALWTFREPSSNGISTEFIDAAPAKDGGVLICARRVRTGTGVGTSGLLIRLDSDGREVNRVDYGIQDLYQENQFSDVISCSALDNGFVVFGATRIVTRAQGSNSMKVTSTLMRLHENGSLAFQKAIQLRGQPGRMKEVMPNGDIVLFGPGASNGASTEFVMRIDQDGNVSSIGEIDPSCQIVSQIALTDQLQFICYSNDPRVKTQLLELSSDLRIAKRSELNPLDMSVKRAFLTPNRSIVLMGYTMGIIQRFIPTLIELAPDGSIAAKYEFSGAKELWIADGLPTGIDDEFVTVRSVGQPNFKTAMAFVRRNK